jgi:protease IV
MAERRKRGNAGKIFLIIAFLFIILIGIGIYRAFNPSVKAPSESVLVLRVSGPLPENEPDEAPFSFRQRKVITQESVLRLLDKARRDESVKQVLVDVGSLPGASFAKLDEIRQAVEAYKTSGKPIYAYVRFPSDAQYYLASACDKIYAEPMSEFSLDGLGMEMIYFRTALDKIGVEFDQIGHYKYKSATEPFTRDSSSLYDREQRGAILDALDSAYITGVAASRKMPKEEFRRIVNDLALIGESDALKLKLIDSLVYFPKLKEGLRSQYSVESDDELFLTNSEYEGVSVTPTGSASGAKVAVVHIEGSIVDGRGGPGNVGDVEIVKSLNDAGNDQNIKAIILRVDSPGGSAIASEKMRVAMLDAKKNKPVIVSMSGVAASGGYWVAMDATKILASPLTITGSIGVFGLIPNAKKLREMTGLKRESTVRSQYANALSAIEKMPAGYQQKLEQSVERIYSKFITSVAVGRKKSVVEVDAIAQGRVWMGAKAKELGLVDELGGFRAAIKSAKQLAGIDTLQTVQLVNYPKSRTWFEQVSEDYDDDSEDDARVKTIQSLFTDDMLTTLFGESLFKEDIDLVKTLIRTAFSVKKLSAQARLPFAFTID